MHTPDLALSHNVIICNAEAWIALSVYQQAGQLDFNPQQGQEMFLYCTASELTLGLT
jgi:hypothetical protein